MSEISKKIFGILQKTSATIVLVPMVFIFSHLFFLQRSILFDDLSFEDYKFLLIANISLIFTTVLITDNKIVRIIYFIFLIFLIIFLIVLTFFVLWLKGMAKAFNNG